MYSIDDLRSNILFKDVDLGSLDFNFDPKNVNEIKEGEIFYRSGDDANFFYLIINGRVKLKHSVSKKVLIKSSKEFFGETEIIQDLPRTFSVLADSDCVIYKIESEVFKNLIKSSEKIKNTIYENLHHEQLAKPETSIHPLPSIEVKGDTIKIDIKNTEKTPPPTPPIEKPIKANHLVDRILNKTQVTTETQNPIPEKNEELKDIVEEVFVSPEQSIDFSKITSEEKIEIEESTDFVKAETKKSFDKIEVIETVSGFSDKSSTEKEKFNLNIPENFLDKFEKILKPSPDLNRAAKDIFYFLLKITDSEIGAFYLFNAEENKLEETYQSFSSFYKSKRPIKDGITAIVAKEKKLRIVDSFVNDSSFNPDVDLPNEFKGQTLIFIPLVDMKNNLLAIVQVGSDQAEFSKDEIKTFEYATQYASYVLYNSIHYNKPLDKKEEPVDIRLVANFILDDVKIPLTTIKKYASLLTKLDLTDEAKKASSIILAKSISTFELLQTFLEVAEGKNNLIFEVIGFKDALNHILSMLADSVDLRKTKLFKKFSDDAIVKIDTHKLYVSCYYISKFSSDLMPDGNKLYFSNYIDGNKIILKINDESSSLGNDILENVFDDFFYMNNEKKTGIGLSVAKKLITNMNGEFKIETASKGISYLISFDIISR